MEKIKAVDKIFKAVIIAKGIHAIIELLIGIALILLSKEYISRLIVILVDAGLAGHPENFIAEYITQFGIDLSSGIKFFLAFYFLSHGVVNFSLVYGIVKRPSFAYPLSLVVFFGFLVYQVYSYIKVPSAWLLIIAILDVLFLVLLFYEYHHHLKKYSFWGKLRLIVKAEVPNIVEIKLPKIRFVNRRRLVGRRYINKK